MSLVNGKRVHLARLACAALAVSAVAAGLAPQAQAAKAGSLDRSFGNDGRQLVDFGRHEQASALALQADGRIVVAGWIHKPKISADQLPAIARCRRDGRLDPSFGHDGKVLLRGWNSGQASALAIQENGEIVVAGNASPDLAVSRLRRDGKLDRSFGDGGTVRTGLRPGLNHATDVAIQPDGKIVVVGYTRGAADGATYLIMARYRRDGSLDQGFGDNGSVITQFGTDTYVLGYGVALQEDGRIVVSGEVGNSWILARFMPDGSIDSGFGNDNGVQHTDPVLAGRAEDVAIQPDGRIVAAGVDFGGVLGSAHFAVARYLPDGSPDSSFGEAGAVRTAFERGRPHDYANALALQPDGKIVAAGAAKLGGRPIGPPRFALARYRPDGRLDRSFAGDGKRIMGFPYPPIRYHYDVGEALALQGGRILLAGYTEVDWALARFLGSARR